MMLEKLLVLAIFAEVGIIPKAQYLDELNRQFLETPDNDLLLGLEILHDNTHSAAGLIYNDKLTVDDHVFSKSLLNGISEVYWSNKFSLQKFSQKAYLIWQYFPVSMRDEEPYFTLCYADDCLAYGDEQQTKELYEEAFSYYDNNVACLV